MNQNPINRLVKVCGKDVVLPEPNQAAILEYIGEFIRLQQKKAECIEDSSEDHDKPFCWYRMDENNRVYACAVGCLIPDDDYNKNIEHNHITNDRIVSILDKYGYKQHLGFLRTIQILHDTNEFRVFLQHCQDIVSTMKGA